MAYFSQAQKKEMEPKIKAILSAYNTKGTMRVHDYQQVELVIRSGPFHIQGGGKRVWIRECKGQFAEMVSKLFDALNEGNYDTSRPEIDHFNVGWYVAITIGEYGKPYKQTK